MRRRTRLVGKQAYELAENKGLAQPDRKQIEHSVDPLAAEIGRSVGERVERVDLVDLKLVDPPEKLQLNHKFGRNHPKPTFKHRIYKQNVQYSGRTWLLK